jgi:2-C-methyl-D-erythritol 2,4-cyclodiphosphate synthase
VVGGIVIESDLGAEGHSDADPLAHAITDAILGALALGDIGSHFPNTDERWANAESFVFLRFSLVFCGCVAAPVIRAMMSASGIAATVTSPARGGIFSAVPTGVSDFPVSP